MKQSVQQLKRTRTKMVHKKPSQSAYVRPFVVHQSNHTLAANDKWERQADEAATRVIRGEEGVLRHLTPIAAAARTVTASRSEPLPGILIGKLEKGFGADLSTVRIHRDAAAAQAARAENSQAFTSGVDIYFAVGQFNPHSGSGVQLLMHEVSHVLQQTARPGHGGIYTLRDVTGQGNIQRKFTTFKDWKVFTGQERLAHLRKLHETNDPKLKVKLDAWLPGLLTDSTKMTKDQMKEAIEKRVDGTTDKGELGFLLDLSRFFPGVELSAKIVRKNAWVRTLFPNEKVLKYLVKNEKSKKWWLKSLTQTYVGKLFWPQGFKDVVKDYIWNPSPKPGVKKNYLNIKPNKGKATISGSKQSVEKELGNLDKLHYSEWTFAPLIALKAMEDFLKDKFKLLDEMKEFTEQNPAGEQKQVGIDNLYKRQLAKVAVLKKDAQNMLALDNSDVDAYWWAWNGLGQIILDEATAFQKYIQPVLDDVLTHGYIFNKWNASLGSAKNHPLNEYIKALPGLPKLLAPAGVKLATAANTFFLLTPEKDRTKRYAGVPAKATVFIDKINAVANDYTEKAFAALKESQTKIGPEKNTAEKTAQALFWFAGMISHYGTNTGFMTDKGMAKVGKDEKTDIIILNRFERARELMGIATILKASDNSWVKIIELADKVSKGKFIQTSDLAIQYAFEVDQKADVNLIPKDIGTKSIKGLEPFTSYDLVFFYSSNILKEYNNILRPMVQNNEIPFVNATRSASDLFMIGKADQVMENILDIRPHRWVSPEAYWIKFPTDPATQFAASLQEHSKFKALHKQEKEKKRELMYRMTGLNKGSKVVIWSIPLPGDLIRSLRKIKLLNAIVYLFRSRSSLFDITKEKDDEGVEKIKEVALNDKVMEEAKKVLEKNAKIMDTLTDWEWYTSLTEIKGIRNLLVSSKSSIHSDISKIKTDLRTNYKTNTVEYRDLQRRATNLDREVLGVTDKYSIQNLLSAYDGTITSYKYLRAALKRLRTFERNIGPPDERELQMSAIMMENGSKLLEKLKDINFYYYASNFYPFISRALANADKTLTAGNILGGTPDQQKATKKWGVLALEALKNNMISRLVVHQKKFGMQANKGSQKLTSFMQKSFAIRAGEPKFDKDEEKVEDSPDGPFKIDGLNIYIKEVMRSFTYFPRLGVEGLHSLYAPTRLYLDKFVDSPTESGFTDDARKTGQEPIKLIKVALIFKSKIYEFYITTKDLEDKQSGLAWLNHVVTMRSTVKNLENLQEIIEVFGEGMMFILSLTPIGWAADLAMLIGMVAEAFSNNPEGIKAQLEALFNEPEEMFKKLQEAINKSLDPEKLLEIFLLGENHYKDLIKVKPKKRPVRGKSSRKRKVAKALKGVRNLGTSVAVQVVQLQGKVQNKASAVRATVVSRPILSAILMWTVDNWDNFSKPEKIILQHRVLGPIYEMIMVLSKLSGGANLAFDKDSAKNQGNAFAEKIDAVLLQMTNLELPHEVIPNDLIVGLLVDAFTDFVARRAPGKIKILTRIINEGAEFLGAKDALAETLAEKMKGTGLDPNTYWLEYFLPVIERPFNDGLEKLNTEITQILSKAPILKDLPLKALAKQEVKVTTSNELNDTYSSNAAKELEEQAGTNQAIHSPYPGSASGIPHYRPEPIRSGRPMSKELRRSNEINFGHDFSHVRLHTDAAADKRTRSLGANALTSGSHIFMRTGMTPHYGEGSKVLRHELAHVLQKTGPRPIMSGEHSNRPVLQRGSSAIRSHRGEESGADTMAAKANSSSFKSPVPVIGLHKNGVSPNSSGAVKNFIREVSDVKAVEEQYTKVKEIITNKTKLNSATANLDDKVKKHARDLWRGISDNIKNKRFLDYAQFWKKRSAQTKALGYINTAIKSSAAEGSMTNAVDLLAAENQTEKKVKGRAGTKPKKVKVLDQGSFLKSLELYLLKRTGIPITFSKVNYDPEKAPAVGQRVKDINIGGIQLRWVDANLAPWGDVISSTWGSENSGKRTRYKKAAKNVLDNSHPTRNVWDGNEYKFSKDFADEVVESTKGKKLEAKDLPSWDVFIKNSHADKTVPGVRLSTHGDFTSNYPLSALDRQSHHTTQFLVAEYFHNGKTFKPFPTDRNWPASVVSAAGVVSKIKKSSNSSKEVKVQETYAGKRGGKMPAILLSAETHLGAGLHVTPRGDEKTSPTQGYSINSDFDGFMPTKMKQSVAKEDHNEYVKRHSAKAEKEIYIAVQKTYKTIRDDMASKLTDKFPDSEMKYFARIAGNQLTAKTSTIAGSENTKKEEMKKNLKVIADKVTEKTTGHNDKILIPLGWKADDTN